MSLMTILITHDLLPVVLVIGLLAFSVQAFAQGADVVHGQLIQINDNGAWCWFQDERAVVNAEGGFMIVGSVANGSGVGGEKVDGQIRASCLDLQDMTSSTSVLGVIRSYGAGDDHNTPAFLVKQDGHVLAFYTGHNVIDHNENYLSFYRTYDPDTKQWGEQSAFDWSAVIPDNAPGRGGVTYSNLFLLKNEDPNGDGHGRIYNIARVHQSPHIMFSDDNGATWQYGGQLTKQQSTPPSSSYVNGYYKYASNGLDRIDVIATEYHPRDYNCSLYHAYIKGGKLHDSFGKVIDEDVFNTAGSFDPDKVASTDDFTMIFKAGEKENSRAWNTDVHTYPDGSISVLFKARAGGYEDHTKGTEDQNVWLARLEPGSDRWQTHKVAHAGGILFPGHETDYTGLGALDPQNPDVLYISTDVNPITHERTSHHEIYRGQTDDDGASWSWTPITENSTVDNLRPIVPAWQDDRTLLMWFRGTMTRSQSYDTKIVGLMLP